MAMYNNVRVAYYFGALAIAIVSGIWFGYVGIHSPPVPFLIEMLVVPVGLLWLLIDSFIVTSRRTQTWQEIRLHVIGIMVNTLFAISLVLPFEMLGTLI